MEQTGVVEWSKFIGIDVVGLVFLFGDQTVVGVTHGSVVCSTQMKKAKKFVNYMRESLSRVLIIETSESQKGSLSSVPYLRELGWLLKEMEVIYTRVT